MKSLQSIALAIALFLLSGFVFPVARAADPAATSAVSSGIEKPRKGWMAPIFAEAVKWTDVAQLAVAIIGFVLILLQLGKLKEQLAGDAYTSLYEQYVEVGKLFLERPELRPYFYNDDAVDERARDGKTTLAQVEIVAELMTGLLEHAALQRKSMPKKIYEQCWQEYTRERFEKSPALRAFWEENKGWYAEKFYEIADDCVSPWIVISADGRRVLSKKRQIAKMKGAADPRAGGGGSR
jgi:hypothetical protein